MENTMTRKEKIEAICTKGYQLDFGTVFESAFENYKKIALYAGLMLLVSIIILGAIGFGVGYSVYGIADFTKLISPENLNPKNFSSTFLVGYILGIALISSFLNPFYAGFLKMADCGEKGEEFNVATMFEYYKSSYFKEIFISTLLISLTSAGISTLLQIVNLDFVGAIISYAISFFTFLTIPLIVFGNLQAVDAIKSSFAIVIKQPLVLLGLLIVAIIVSFLGIFGLCIGIFFTLPFMFSTEYSIYSAIVGIDAKSEIDEIGTTEI